MLFIFKFSHGGSGLAVKKRCQECGWGQRQKTSKTDFFFPGLVDEQAVARPSGSPSVKGRRGQSHHRGGRRRAAVSRGPEDPGERVLILEHMIGVHGPLTSPEGGSRQDAALRANLKMKHGGPRPDGILAALLGPDPAQKNADHQAGNRK